MFPGIADSVPRLASHIFFFFGYTTQSKIGCATESRVSVNSKRVFIIRPRIGKSSRRCSAPRDISTKYSWKLKRRRLFWYIFFFSFVPPPPQSVCTVSSHVSRVFRRCAHLSNRCGALWDKRGDVIVPLSSMEQHGQVKLLFCHLYISLPLSSSASYTYSIRSFPFSPTIFTRVSAALPLVSVYLVESRQQGYYTCTYIHATYFKTAWKGDEKR